MAGTNLGGAFNPRSVAAVGDKKETGYFWLKSLRTFQGELYSVQIDPAELPGIEALGVKNYPSLLDIPGPVDYAVVAVPRQVTPRIIADCIRKGVKGVAVFTSGFAESGTEEGRKLQQLLTQMATDSGLNLIGPNCMGIYNPRIGLRHTPWQPVGQAGNVGFISQSGTHATMLSLVAPGHGIRISKSVSYGNGIVLDSPDYLEYLAQDDETEMIAMYIEGVRDGRRLFRNLQQTVRQKPVVIWKGGQTADGARAILSHTASLAQSPLIWQSLFRQCGAIEVDSLEEMTDSVKALLYVKPTTGNRVGVIVLSGGQSVAIADAFGKEGFQVPPLTQRSYEALTSSFHIIGGSLRNPLDVSWSMLSAGDLVAMLGILDSDDDVDVLVLELPAVVLIPYARHHPEFLPGLVDSVAQFKAQATKPFFTILTPAHHEAEALKLRDMLTEKGIPSFPSFQRGARALRQVTDYYTFRRQLGLSPAVGNATVSKKE